MVESLAIPAHRRAAPASLYDLLSVPVPPALDRWVPGWAVPPVYGAGSARSVPSVLLSACSDKDSAAIRLGSWAVGYGRCVASVDAPDPVVYASGMWQLAAHLAAAAVVAHIRDGFPGAATFVGLLADLVGQLWPAWGRASTPAPGRLRAGMAVHRHVAAWHRDLPPDAGVDQLVRCATSSGSQVPAAQHRLMHLVVQQPDRLRAVAAVLEFTS